MTLTNDFPSQGGGPGPGEQEASFERVRPLIFELLMRPKYPLFLSVFPMSVHPNLHFILLKKEKKGCEPVGKLNLARKERNASYHGHFGIQKH